MPSRRTQPKTLIQKHLGSVPTCKECELGKQYCGELRTRNLRLLMEFTPARVKKVIFCESPPKSYGYIYDEFTTSSSGKMSYKVFKSLGCIPRTRKRTLEPEEKAKCLDE
jgi:hypothetical protein